MGFLTKIRVKQLFDVIRSKFLLEFTCHYFCFVQFVGLFLSSVSYSDLTIIYLYCICTHTPNFCKLSQSLHMLWLLANLKFSSVKPSKSSWNLETYIFKVIFLLYLEWLIDNFVNFLLRGAGINIWHFESKANKQMCSRKL